MRAPTQKELILKYLHEYGTITPMEAFSHLGITKLATRVSEMRRYDGVKFHIEPVTKDGKYGRKITYAKYSLLEEK